MNVMTNTNQSNDYNGINNRTVEDMARQHQERLNQDQRYKQSVITKYVTEANTERYSEIVESALEDLSGLAEAYKDNAITSEGELHQDIRIFLEEYTVNLFNMLSGKK
jgi:hypothetical protein